MIYCYASMSENTLRRPTRFRFKHFVRGTYIGECMLKYLSRWSKWCSTLMYKLFKQRSKHHCLRWRQWRSLTLPPILTRIPHGGPHSGWSQRREQWIGIRHKYKEGYYNIGLTGPFVVLNQTASWIYSLPTSPCIVLPSCPCAILPGSARKYFGHYLRVT